MAKRNTTSTKSSHYIHLFIFMMKITNKKLLSFLSTVLKYANSVLKGYATAVSVVLTGVSSHILFGTELTMFYAMGIFNVVAAVLLYNSNDLDAYLC